MDTQTIFITGGYGYVGFPTVQALLEKGYHVIVFDRIVPSEKKQIHHPLYTSIQGDVCDYDALIRAMETWKPSFVIHLAAKVSVSESEHQKKLYEKVNVDGTKYVLRAMHENGCTKIMFSSSAAVYDVCNTSIAEHHTLRPSSYYGETKKEAEMVIQKEKNIQSVILRYFNVVGKESIEKNPKLIPSALRVVKELQKELILYGHDYPTPDGTAIRDYIHIDDVVAANCASIAYLKHSNDSLVCNIGSGIGVSNDSVVREVERLCDTHIPVVYTEKRKEAVVSIANIEKAKALLRWEPHYSSLSSIINSFS